MWLRRILTFALVCFVCGMLLVAAFMAAGALPVQDFAQYWSAAHLVRQNPYSYSSVAQFERSQGIFTDPPLVLKNPPWSIPFILPIGLFSYRFAFAIWTLISLVCLMASVRLIWQRLNPAPSSLKPLLVPLLFGPVLVQLMLGQWTILVFLGISVFLVCAEQRRDWLAGAALVLVFGKPHVALLFLIVVALWAVQQRRWRLLLSSSLALLAASAIVTVLNPHIWTQFLQRTILVMHETEIYPNLGGMLYATFGRHYAAYFPQLCGLVWVLIYWRKHGRHWNWWDHGTVVLLCSVVCSYYSYPYDEILALPALLIAFANSASRAFLILFVLTEAGYAVYLSNVAGHFGYGYTFLWWTASGWLIAFAAYRLQTRQRQQTG